MGFSEFWLQLNNGKKQQLSELKYDIARETVSEKFRTIFDIFDINKNGTLEKSEAEFLFEFITGICDFNHDKTISPQETSFLPILLGIDNPEDVDFNDFVAAITQASESVKSSQESTLPDGCKKVIFNYKNGARITTVYYPDGDMKYRVVDIPAAVNNKFGTVSKINNSNKEIDTRKTIEKDENVLTEGRTVKTEFSPRAEKDLRLKFGEIYKDVAENIKNTISKFEQDETIWDRAGIDAMQMVEDLNPAELYTAEGQKRLSEYKSQATQNVDKGQKLVDMAANATGVFDFHLEKDFGMKSVDLMKLEEFHQTATKYTNAKALKQRIDLLNDGIKRVKKLYNNFLAVKRGVPNADKLNTDYAGEFMNVLTQYFDGDDELARAFFATMKEGLETGDKDENEESGVFLEILDNVQKSTEKTLADNLDGETFENLEDRFKKDYKELYGEEDFTNDVEKMIEKGAEYGGTIKLGAMVAAQIALNSLTFGTGNIALISLAQSPLVQYLETVGTDYALSMLGALSSQTGLTSEKHEQILEGTKSTAAFVGIGQLSAPVCNVVGKALGKYTGKLFEGGSKTTAGAVTKTTVSGTTAIKNLCEKAAETAGSFTSEVGVFTLYETALQDEEFSQAFSSQGNNLLGIKVLNKFLTMMMGKFANNQAMKGQQKLQQKQIENMLKESGIENAKISKLESPTGTRYTAEIDGITINGKTEIEVLSKMLLIATAKMKELEDIDDEIPQTEPLGAKENDTEVKTAGDKNESKMDDSKLKEFKQKLSSILDETGKPVFSDFTINKFVEKYGTENVQKLTQLYETISQKFPNNSQASIDLFKTIVENEAFINCKDFSLVEKVLNQFELTTETTGQISNFFANLTNDRLEMSNLLFDVISRDKNSKSSDIATDFESFNDYIKFIDKYNLSGIKRIAELTDENGNYILNSGNIGQRFAYSQLAACDDLSNTDIINIINLQPMLPRIKGVKGRDALARPENKALRAELRDIANEKNPETRNNRLIVFVLKQKINNIQNKDLQSWVKKTVRNLKENSAKDEFVDEITELLDNKSFSDARLNTQIYKCIEEISKNYDDKTFVETKLDELKRLVSMNDTLAGRNSSLGGTNSLDDMAQSIKNKSEDDAKRFLRRVEIFEKELERHNNNYPAAIRDYKKGYSGYDDSFVDYVYTKKTVELKDFMVENLPKLREELAQLKQEYQKNNNIEIKEKIVQIEKKLAVIDGMYEETYLSTVPEESREILKRINSEYGTKVFLAHDTDASVINYIYNEFLEWQKAGKGQVKYPPVLDLSRANSVFVENEDFGGFYRIADQSIRARGRYRVQSSLRHEMMHANDQKLINGHDIREVKNDKGEITETINFEDIKNNKKYYDELVNAGVSREHANYAYKNFAEFIAVSAEGDFTKYSPEFKEFLVKIGMPKWVFNMQPTGTLSHAQNIYTQADVNWKYSLYQNKLISINSQKLFNNTSMNATEVAKDYEVFNGINGNVTTRVKDFDGVNEKIYREIKRVDKEIEEWMSRQKDPQKLAAYNAKMKAKGKDEVKFEEIPSKINGLQTKRANLFSDYDTVHDTVIDTFGARIVMEDCSPKGVQKIVDKLIEQIDKGEIEIIALDNYYGTNGTPYFSAAQVEAIRKHCLAKGQKIEINISEKASGYTTSQLNIKHKNGVISELQIRGPEINKQAEAEHLYYDFCQNKNPITKYPALEPILSPLKDVVENLNKHENAKLKAAYEQYLTACYKKARAIEEHKPYKEPVFPSELNPILKMENLDKMHTLVEKIKKTNT